MKRLVLAALLALAAPAAEMVCAVSAAQAAQLPAQLKPSAMVEGDMVRLGDLWDNLGGKGETPIAAAPQPGKRIVADLRWLMAVARSQGIDWQPVTSFDRIVIERAGRVVDAKTIETELREALEMEGVRAPFEVEINNRSGLSITVAADETLGIAVRDLQWDQRSSRFSAVIEAPAGAPNATRQRVNGRVFQVTRIPTLARAMGRGQVVSAADVEWQTVRDDLVRPEHIRDVNQLVGQEPRNPVRAGAPLRVGEFQRPVMVQRNSTVTIVLKTPFMSLTSQGRAAEDGGKGDVVHIVNLQTKRTVEAVVEGPGTVSVASNGARMLSN